MCEKTILPEKSPFVIAWPTNSPKAESVTLMSGRSISQNLGLFWVYPCYAAYKP